MTNRCWNAKVEAFFREILISLRVLMQRQVELRRTVMVKGEYLKFTQEKKISSTSLSLDEIEKEEDGVEDDDEQYNDNQEKNI